MGSRALALWPPRAAAAQARVFFALARPFARQFCHVCLDSNGKPIKTPTNFFGHSRASELRSLHKNRPAASALGQRTLKAGLQVTNFCASLITISHHERNSIGARNFQFASPRLAATGRHLSGRISKRTSSGESGGGGADKQVARVALWWPRVPGMSARKSTGHLTLAPDFVPIY